MAGFLSTDATLVWRHNNLRRVQFEFANWTLRNDENDERA